MIEDSTFEKHLIKVGQSATENDTIIKEAKPTDLWFHLSNLPSCHVIVENSKKTPVTKQIIKYCASLCKQNTKYKKLKKIKVNYTEIRNVRLTDTPGRVILKGKVNTLTI